MKEGSCTNNRNNQATGWVVKEDNKYKVESGQNQLDKEYMLQSVL